MSKPEWGSKRTCQSCLCVFYDMKKDPISCPKCKSIYNLEELIKSSAEQLPNVDSNLEKDISEASLEDLGYQEDEEIFLDNQDDFLESLEEFDDEFEPRELQG